MHIHTVTTCLLMTVLGPAHAQSLCRTPFGDQGMCVRVVQCPAILSLIKSTTSWGISLARRSICGYERHIPFVCCAQSNPRTIASVSSTVHPETSLLPRTCGKCELGDKVVNGVDAKMGAYPWMTVFGERTLEGLLKWFCGGALINDKYILTAAHCFNTPPRKDPVVRLGEHRLSSNPDCHRGVCAPGVINLKAAEIVTHSSYGNPCVDCNDIALVRLASRVSFGKYVSPICLPINPARDMGFPIERIEDKVAIATGWGRISQDPLDPRGSDVLQQVNLPLQPLPVCTNRRKLYPDPLMVICAGGNKSDTCSGDSGGPLMVTNAAGNTAFLVGITSVGPQFCGTPMSQGFYTNVHFYTDWILENLKP